MLVVPETFSKYMDWQGNQNGVIFDRQSPELALNFFQDRVGGKYQISWR